jgi:hypothetical protein
MDSRSVRTANGGETGSSPSNAASRGTFRSKRRNHEFNLD